MTLRTIKAINALGDALSKLSVPVFYAKKAKDVATNYITYREDLVADTMQADGHMQLEKQQGVVDFYTKTPLQPILAEITDAIDSVENMIIIDENTQYENETNQFHYHWVFEVI
jgi:hypothetical protein